MEDLLNPHIMEVEGVYIPKWFSKECFQSALRFFPKPRDIIIATYPKCGTTWMQNLVINILRRGKPLEKPSDFYLASPFLDQLGSEDSENMMIRPGAYKTHLPFSKVPWSDEAKYIYVARNPKDCCISYYHHMRQLPTYQLSDTFEEFLKYFLKGQVDFNDYFENLLGWYNMRNAPNVYFTTFEMMKRDLKTIALDVAEFIDPKESGYLKENQEILEEILHKCSFDEMKKFIDEAVSTLYKVNKNDSRIPRARKHILEYAEANVSSKPTGKINFLRKGESRNWKHEMTADQNKKLNEWIYERTKGSDVMTLWEDIDIFT